MTREQQEGDALRELQRAAHRRAELADAFQRKSEKYRAEARELRRLVTRIARGASTPSEAL